MTLPSIHCLNAQKYYLSTTVSFKQFSSAARLSLHRISIEGPAIWFPIAHAKMLNLVVAKSQLRHWIETRSVFCKGVRDKRVDKRVRLVRDKTMDSIDAVGICPDANETRQI